MTSFSRNFFFFLSKRKMENITFKRAYKIESMSAVDCIMKTSMTWFTYISLQCHIRYVNSFSPRRTAVICRWICGCLSSESSFILQFERHIHYRYVAREKCSIKWFFVVVVWKAVLMKAVNILASTFIYACVYILHITVFPHAIWNKMPLLIF